MNEERQAELLAQWLDGPDDRGAPEGVDADVLEAIYVLRPERAPAPRVTIEDILAGVIADDSSTWSEELGGGDTWSEELGADPLESGLLEEPLESTLVDTDPGEGTHTDPLGFEPFGGESGPDTDPVEPPTDLFAPDDSPTEMFGAAPPEEPETEVTATSIDGIEALGEITPAFGGMEKTEVVVRPPTASKVIPFRPDPSRAATRNSGRAERQPPADMPPPPPRGAQPPASQQQLPPVVMPSGSDISEFPALGVEEPTPPEEVLPPPPTTLEAAPHRPVGRRRWLWASGGGAGLLAAAAALFMVFGPSVQMSPEAEQAAYAPAASADMAEVSGKEMAPAEDAPADAYEGGELAKVASRSDEARSAGFGAGGAPEPEPTTLAPTAPTQQAAAAEDAGDAVADLDVAGLDDLELDDEELETEELEAEALEEEATAEADYAPAAGAPARDRSTSRPEKKAEARPDLSVERAAAQPRDYSDDWYLTAGLDPETLTRINQAIQAVDTDLRFDDFGAASVTCEGMIGDPDVRVGQDFAFRAATYARKAGQRERAMALAEQGIGRSSANTPFLSALHHLLGQLQEAEGRYDEARRSYQAAAALNEARL
jgi:tetratricopeptide (TPR) repeat protein